MANISLTDISAGTMMQQLRASSPRSESAPTAPSRACLRPPPPLGTSRSSRSQSLLAAVRWFRTASSS